MALPSTTIVPFKSLPSCAAACGPLYDANGACVPPAAPAGDADSYGSCFCKYNKLQGFNQGTSGVCDAACPQSPQDLSSIQGWFTSFCQDKGGAAGATSATASASSSSTRSPVPQGGGGDWLSTHVQWVVMIVIVIVGIIGIWVGACIWRRKYLKKKDRMYELGKGLPSSVAVNTQGNLVGPGARSSTYSSEPGVFMASSAAEKANRNSAR